MTHLPDRKALAGALLNEWLRSTGGEPTSFDDLPAVLQGQWLTKADQCLAALAALSAPAAEPGVWRDPKADPPTDADRDARGAVMWTNGDRIWEGGIHSMFVETDRWCRTADLISTAPAADEGRRRGFAISYAMTRHLMTWWDRVCEEDQREDGVMVLTCDAEHMPIAYDPEYPESTFCLVNGPLPDDAQGGREG